MWDVLVGACMSARAGSRSVHISQGWQQERACQLGLAAGVCISAWAGINIWWRVKREPFGSPTAARGRPCNACWGYKAESLARCKAPPWRAMGLHRNASALGLPSEASSSCGCCVRPPCTPT